MLCPLEISTRWCPNIQRLRSRSRVGVTLQRNFKIRSKMLLLLFEWDPAQSNLHTRRRSIYLFTESFFRQRTGPGLQQQPVNCFRRDSNQTLAQFPWDEVPVDCMGPKGSPGALPLSKAKIVFSVKHICTVTIPNRQELKVICKCSSISAFRPWQGVISADDGWSLNIDLCRFCIHKDDPDVCDTDPIPCLLGWYMRA